MCDDSKTNSTLAKVHAQNAANVATEASTPKFPAQQVALFALRFYKAYLSILFAGSCRFEPTCSQYAYEAVERFGVWRGAWLALKRLLRCHPLSRKFGFDPVPERWEEMPTEFHAAGDSALGAATTESNEVRS